jgi:hypothetical protein
MTQHVQTTTRSSSSCGCGSGSSKGGCGGSCGCGGGCSVTGDGCMTGPLQRPVFFSGQLLTEDDLQQLSDYTAAKSRLHNRFLHGAGVVCGLQVTCHPCGGGKVIVQPGHALDCCGNDIHVACAVELDINKMVGELRLEMRGGYDCGDPCAAPCDDEPDSTRCLDRKARKYDLYVSYCEQGTEPVVPYVTGGNCAPQQCKATRIVEGYKFELRCRTPQKRPDDIFNRLLCCIGDLTQTEKVASDAYAVDLYSRKQAAAKAQMQAQGAPTFAQPEIATIDRVAAKGELQKSDVARALDEFLAASAAVVRFDLQPEARKAELVKADQGLAGKVEQVRSMLQEAVPELRQKVTGLSTPRDQTIADTWLDQGQHFMSAEKATAADTGELHSYAYGVPKSAAIGGSLMRDLSAWRDWLIDRVEAKPSSSDCRLRADVHAIILPARDSDDAEAFESASGKLKEATLRYVIDCICAALNPPCNDCEDDAVKLAGLTIEDCDVTRICNLERTFVLSGPAMRYCSKRRVASCGSARSQSCQSARRMSPLSSVRPVPIHMKYST